MNQMSRSVGVFFRTIRAFFNRRIMAVSTYLRRVTNFSRHAMKVATNSMQTVASAVKKPTRREDYVETSQLFIAKSFLIKMALLLAALGLIGYFLVWPFILSHFFTVRFYVQDSRVPDWSGRVIVFSDPEKTLPLYAGRLEEGVLQGRGEDYDENGLLAYEGQFLDGVRSGEGTAYEDGVLCYEGQFAGGLYEGRGRRYQDGALAYEGSFAAGVASGEGVAYYPNGQEAYRGQFANDLYEGQGAAYTEAGDKLYEGSFARGLYNGSGRLYLGDNQWITAEFQDGQPAGVVQWYKGGRLYYEGEWADGRPQGYGALYNKTTGARVRALVAVHVFGNMADLPRLTEIARRYNLVLIEDATEALGTRYTSGPFAGRMAGTIGDVGVYSFNGNKIITTGAGGMVVSNHPDWAEHAKHLSTQAKSNELQFFHDEVGYNYRMTNLQAALGLAQLEQLEGFIAHKHARWQQYKDALDGVNGYRILGFREDCTRPNKWFYSLYLTDERHDRDTLIQKLHEQSIQTRPVWALIHQQADYGRNEAYAMAKAEDYRAHIVNLPCSTNLSEEDCQRVIDALLAL